MFKLNFEKTVLFVLILIILISTVNIYDQYFKNDDIYGEDGAIGNFEQSDLPFVTGVPTTLFKADKLYEEQNYEAAAKEYGRLITEDKFNTPQQKSLANFKLGMSYYRLKDYNKAMASFINCLQYNSNDAVVYNNSAICAFYLKDYKKAVEYQQKALSISPTVEYYYNMGRIYETITDYANAAKYYAGVIKGEENLTYSSYIDPVNIKGKFNKLAPDQKEREDLYKQITIALRQKDMREILILEDRNMNIKSYDFECRIYYTNGSKRLSCKYDIEKNDPYGLINSLSWVVKSNGIVKYESSKDSFTINISGSENYVIELYINYGNGSIKYSYQKIDRDQIVNKGTIDRNDDTEKEDIECKSYTFASYEQLFEENFKLSSNGYRDRFSVNWGKDNIYTEIVDGISTDGKSSLYIRNDSDSLAGIWANLSSLIKTKDLGGKKVSIKFYGRKVTENGRITVRVRTKSNNMYDYAYGTFSLDSKYKWSQVGLDVDIPADCQSFTLSMDLDKNEAVEIDGLIVYVK